MTATEEVGNAEQVRSLLAFLDVIAEQHSWEIDAACHGMTHLFFPANGQEKLAQEAKRVCETCPVLRECQEASRDELYGVWGARSVEERRALRREAAS